MTFLTTAFICWLGLGILVGVVLLVADWLLERRERRPGQLPDDVYRRFYERWGREVVAEAQQITADAARKRA